MNVEAARNLQRIGFVLLPNFALMSYASAIEPLRAANMLAGVPLYEIVAYSATGEPVRSSAGVSVECRDIQSVEAPLHTLFVCAGGKPSDWVNIQAIQRVLQRASRMGVRIGGISSGAYVLASAGLLDDRDFTIHWEHAPALAEIFPQLKPRQARYVIDGNRITCAGGVAPLEMMCAMIGERMGAEFARRVSDWYLHSLIAEADAPQRASHAERFGTHHPALLTVLQKMETTIEQPLGRKAMADLARVTPRHLDRLFKGELASSFLHTYRRIRLEHARRLLQQSPLSVAEIAVACGFSSAGHFSQAFRSEFGATPAGSRRGVG
jgi:AraC family transcriptional regulator, glycine betaine-responsive activator